MQSLWFVPRSQQPAKSRTNRTWREYWDSFGTKNNPRPFILSISSPKDEAWQLLHHMRNFKNPLAPHSGPIPFLCNGYRSYNWRSKEISRIPGIPLFKDLSKAMKFTITILWVYFTVFVYGFVTSLFIDGQIRTETVWNGLKTVSYDNSASSHYIFSLSFGGILILMVLAFVTYLTVPFGISFYLAVLAPVRGLLRHMRATIRTITTNLATYIALRRIWPLMLEKAFGLEGYIFQIPAATRLPTFACSDIYEYRDLSKNAEERALSKRDKWAKRFFDDVSKTLSEMATPDLAALLRMVETDLSLVHAAYYTDDECIDLIADWIAGNAQTNEVDRALTVRLAS